MKKKLILALFFGFFALHAMHESHAIKSCDIEAIVSAIERGDFFDLNAQVQEMFCRDRSLDVTRLINRLAACSGDCWYASRRIVPVAVCLGAGVPFFGLAVGGATCLLSCGLFAVGYEQEHLGDVFAGIAQRLLQESWVVYDRTRLTQQACELLVDIEQKNR